MPTWPRVIPIACPFGEGSVSYAYALDSPRPALIDSGVASFPSAAIVPALLKAGIDPGRLEWILLTHGHWDHAWGAAVLQRDAAPQARVVLHPADVSLLKDADGALHTDRYLAGRQRLAGDVEGAARIRTSVRSSFGGDVPTPQLLADGDLIPLGGGVELRVVHTPGHSPGSVTYVLEVAGWAFAGDAVQVNGSSGSSRFPLYVDPPSYRGSLERLLTEVAPERLFLGHRFLDEDGSVLPPVVVGEQALRVLEASLKAENRIRRGAERAMAGPLSLEALGPAAQALGYDSPGQWPNPLPTTLGGYLSMAMGGTAASGA